MNVKKYKISDDIYYHTSSFLNPGFGEFCININIDTPGRMDFPDQTRRKQSGCNLPKKKL